MYVNLRGKKSITKLRNFQVPAPSLNPYFLFQFVTKIKQRQVIWIQKSVVRLQYSTLHSTCITVYSFLTDILQLENPGMQTYKSKTKNRLWTILIKDALNKCMIN